MNLKKDISVAILCWLFIIWYSPAGCFPDIFTVDDDGPADFSTIQEAIEAAPPNSTIFVFSGTYYENLLIDKPLNIMGEDASTTVISGENGNETLLIISEGVRISEFAIKNRNGYCVKVVNSTDFQFFSNILIDSNVGLYLFNSTGAVITGNYFSNCRIPAFFDSSDQNFMIGNCLENNFGQAFTLYSSSFNVVSRNFISNNPAYGIYLENSHDNVLERNDIQFVCEGIHLESSHSNLIRRNIVQKTGPYGIILETSNENQVCKNFLENNEIALQLSYSHKNKLEGNIITANKFGLFLSNSHFNYLKNNTMNDNYVFGNFGISGEDLTDFINYIDLSNIVNGKPIYYITGKHDLVLSVSAGYIGLINSSNISITNARLEGNYQGITLAYSKNITLSNLSFERNFIGVYMHRSDNNQIARTFFKNNVYDFYIAESNYNTVYHNNIFGGAVLKLTGTENFFDKGYPSGGNYWEKYVGVDKNFGISQNFSGSDGIGDFPYLITNSVVDRYPLAAPIYFFQSNYSREYETIFEVVSNSEISDFNFDPSNSLLSFNFVGKVQESSNIFRITIPKKLLFAENNLWRVYLNNEPENFGLISDDNFTYLYFNTTQMSGTLKVVGTQAIPEFGVFQLTMFCLCVTPIVFLFLKIFKKKFKS